MNVTGAIATGIKLKKFYDIAKAVIAPKAEEPKVEPKAEPKKEPEFNDTGKVATILTLPSFCAMVIYNSLPVNEPILFIKNGIKVQHNSEMDQAKKTGEVKAGPEVGVMIVFKSLEQLKLKGTVVSEDKDSVKIKFDSAFEIVTYIDSIEFFKATFDNFFRTAFSHSPRLKRAADVFMKKIKPTSIKVTQSIPSF
jgi:hypothetical protein